MVTIHDVRQVLGDAVADALFEHFPGQQLNIPKKLSSMKYETLESRDECIFRLYTEVGKSYEEIAELMELSKDRIQKIVIKEYNEKNKQR